jgi:16S rRNA (uracil1498-N3)-methyltransferase
MSKNTRLTPRLFVEQDIAVGQPVALPQESSHYLNHVMRMTSGDDVRLFNGRDGEYLARIGAIKKNAVEVIPYDQLYKQTRPSEIQMCAAPIKKAHFDFMIEKVTELGVGRVQPILTARTQIREVNVERVRSIAIEAAEQSERIDVPEILAPIALKDLIANWSADRLPIVCAEWGDAMPATTAFQSSPKGQPVIIIGPEGGFTEEEFAMLRGIPNALFVRLGPRILRADTAAIAALTAWQALCGDWG